MAQIFATVKVKVTGDGGNKIGRKILKFVAWIFRIKLEVKEDV
jgi:hypothetical protein